MSKFEILMPKLGESIIEATITKWLKKEGETINEDEAILEIATDKVDSEIPSPVAGILLQRLFQEGELVAVGKVIAIIETTQSVSATKADEPKSKEEIVKVETEPVAQPVVSREIAVEARETHQNGRFYSPLIRNIAKKEQIALQELDRVKGTGLGGRLTKADLFSYLENRSEEPLPSGAMEQQAEASVMTHPRSGEQIIEMDRMRKLIADHMVNSVHTSPHVTSFVEVDMSAIVKWREKEKDKLLKREDEKLTYTHIFIDAIANTIKEFPMVNASVDGNKIILKKNINIGMAVALPGGNLIVPVIRDADQKSLLGIVKEVNALAGRARINKLLPDEIQGGTITLTNLGSFGTLMGTPIINQPQLAIVAVGTITKRPVVVETQEGDVIAVRHMMIMSLTYDHRVIDGALGGRFIYRMKEILESFDISRSI